MENLIEIYELGLRIEKAAKFINTASEEQIEKYGKDYEDLLSQFEIRLRKIEEEKIRMLIMRFFQTCVSKEFWGDWYDKNK